MKDEELIARCGADAANHPTVRSGGAVRFKPDPVIALIMDLDWVDLNQLWRILNSRIDNQDVRLALRAFYRGMGYSLCGYLEVFGDMLDREENPEDSWFQSASSLTLPESRMPQESGPASATTPARARSNKKKAPSATR